ncbi:MAG: 3-dehydroquinate synthase [Candidatus Acidiferrales bacterium]
MPIIRVRSSAGSYDVHSHSGSLARASSLISRLSDVTSVFLLSSPRVWSHLNQKVRRSLPGISRRRVILFDDAEAAKNLHTVEALCRALVQSGADRRSVLVAVGGGVVGDVAGFVAASYLRGVRLVHIPTTLVAQVDSSIGGKTGVDLPEGKNLVGSFHPPSLVIADPDLLSTLPHREFRSGLFEVIKCGIIADPALFDFLERHLLSCLRRDPAALARIIDRSIRIKARVVSRDERESGLREILNFGHTLGHGFESATHYRRFLHGEAIAWGMAAATLLSVASADLAPHHGERILRLIARVGPLPALDGIRASELRRIVAGDKKSRGGRIRWVLVPRVGHARSGIEVPWKVVSQALAALPAMLARAEAQSAL